MKLHTKYKGTLGEIAVAQALMRRGLPVFMELGNNNSPIDIITVKKGVLIRIQVKATEPVNGVLKVRAVCVRDRKHIIYNPNDFDVIAVYDVQWDKLYYVPLAEALKCKHAIMSLRISIAKSGRKRVHVADEYKSLNKAVKYLTAENKDDLYKMPAAIPRKKAPEDYIRRFLTIEHAIEMKRLRDLGYSNKEIGKELKCHPKNVPRLLKKYNLKNVVPLKTKKIKKVLKVAKTL